MDLKNTKYILIIGVAGGLAKLTADLLIKTYPHLYIVGLDPRPCDFADLNSSFIFRQMKYSRSTFETIFREFSFDVVLHLGRTSHANANPLGSLAKRLDLNVLGTRRVLDLCIRHEIKKVIILSTYHVYGALSDNPVFINEEAQLRADFKYPEIRDVVEMDQICTNWMWKNRDLIQTVILRPCNIIGPHINNVIQKYLRSNLSPIPIDFNPMFQFLHEYDMVRIILESIKELYSGVYNVAPNDFISIIDAKKVIGKSGIPTSVYLLAQAAKMLKRTFFDIPDYLLDYIKYSCIIDNNLLKKSLPYFKFHFDTKKALEILR